MTEVPASLVTFDVTLDESIESFTEARRSAIRSSLEAELSCFSPSCYVQVALAAGSLELAIIIAVPTSLSNEVVSVAEAVDQLLAPQGASRISTVFGTNVLSSSASPTVQDSVNALIPIEEADTESGEESEGISLVIVLAAVAVAAIAIAAAAVAFAVCCWRRQAASSKAHLEAWHGKANP